MRVNVNGEVTAAALSPAARAKTQSVGLGQDKMSLNGSEQLARALEQVPAVRAEKVAQAKALIQDPSYPSETVLGKVAGVLASSIGVQNQE